jgi:hypothetical protein
MNITCLKKDEHGMQVPHDVQVPRNVMTHRISLILKNNGFCPTGDIDLGNL